MGSSSDKRLLEFRKQLRCCSGVTSFVFHLPPVVYTKVESCPSVPPPFLFPVPCNAPSFPPSLSFTSHQILKLYAWEPSFQAQVEDIRGQELKVMRKFAYLASVSTFIFSCAPALVSAVTWPSKEKRSRRWRRLFHLILCFILQVSLATFAVFVGVSSDNLLTAEKAFTSISLFNILRFPLAMLPMLIAAIVQVRQLTPTGARFKPMKKAH